MVAVVTCTFAHLFLLQVSASELNGTEVEMLSNLDVRQRVMSHLLISKETGKYLNVLTYLTKAMISFTGLASTHGEIC